MARRSRARIVAFQVLYQDDLNSRMSPSVGEEFVRRRLKAEDLAELARELIAGVRRSRAELDAAIAAAAENWSLSRMAATDRNILRLGAFEILYSNTPVRVAIDEAVELAKHFGAAQSGPFVNGILDRIKRTKEERTKDQG
jgi:N utilization substance protein B